VHKIDKKYSNGMTALTPEGFAALLDAAVDGMVIINEQGRVLNFNSAAEQMFGYTTEEVVGQNVSMLMPAPYSQEHDKYLQRYLKTMDPKIIGVGRRAEAQRKDSRVFPIDLSVGEYIDGESRYFVGIIRDLSEQVESERETMQIRQRLAQVDRVNIMGEMASGIAHELNQPLTAISSYVQACRRRLDSDSLDVDKIRELLVKSDEQAQRAGKIIRRIRSLVQSHDKVQETVDINTLVLEVLDLANLDAGRRGIEIELNLAEQGHEVVVDSVQIQQVILNLLRNAIDATELSGNDEKRIVVSSHIADDASSVQVSIRDFSAGVPSAVRENMFDAFVTTKNSGTGMGLSISRSIVQAHGGKIWAENKPRGTLFSFNLPLNRAS
jgi:two-component system sensor kinase FixL